MSRTALVLSAAVCVAALALAPARSLAFSSPAELDLERWIVANGGSLEDVTIGRNKDGVRGLFIKRDAKAGTHVATIPSSTMLNAGSLDSSIVAGTVVVLRELFDPQSRFKPYINVWPKRGEVINQCNFPRKYLYMLDSPYWERIVNTTQDYLDLVLVGKNNHELEWTVKEMVGNAPVTIEDLQYACAVSSTRYVTIEMRRRLMMIPVFDFENHKRTCPHTTTPLDAGDSVSIVLGDDVKAGEELCYSYNDAMRDDYAVVNYGFLPDEEDPPRLLKVDHPYFRDDQETDLSEDSFTGSKEQVVAEVERLRAIQESLKAADAKRPPGPRPGTDWVYDMLVQLQKRRRNAIAYEIARLQEDIASHDEFHASEF